MCSENKQTVLFEHIICAVSWMVGTLWLWSTNVPSTIVSCSMCFFVVYEKTERRDKEIVGG